MIRQWAAFAHHSDPNQDIDGKALPQWTPFTKNKVCTARLSRCMPLLLTLDPSCAAAAAHHAVRQ